MVKMLLREDILAVLRELPEKDGKKRTTRDNITVLLAKRHPNYYPSFSHLCYTLKQMEARNMIRQLYMKTSSGGSGNKVLVELVENAKG
jgi:hypothetical protein